MSIEDPDMRHGRKSNSKLFNGYKQHYAAELDSELILAAAVMPANQPEADAAPALKADIDRQGLTIGELHIDRGYVSSTVVHEVQAEGGEVFCKPWVPKNGDLLAKTDFDINIRNRTITCPSELQTLPFEFGQTVEFEGSTCDKCPLRTICTQASPGTGRSVRINDDEAFQQRMRKLQQTAAGRAKLRERSRMEHRIAHVSRRQGRRARYKGTRKNLFASRRSATIHNLQVIQRKVAS